MTHSDAVGILKSKAVISLAGKYTVKVTNVNPYAKGDTIAIANFNIMNAYQMEEAKGLLREGKFQEATNHGLSLSLRAKDYIPAKGETVDIEVSEVTLKSGEKALLAQSCIQRQAVTASRGDWSEFEVEVEESAPAQAGDLV